MSELLLDYKIIDLLLHFARRGREGLLELSQNSFIIQTNSAGLRFA